MAVDKNTVERIAALAKLSFNEEEKAEVTQDLNRMIEFVAQLQEVDTTDVEPLIYMLEEEAVMRKDEVKQSISQEEALKNAPEKDTDYIKVPKVLKK